MLHKGKDEEKERKSESAGVVSKKNTLVPSAFLRALLLFFAVGLTSTHFEVARWHFEGMQVLRPIAALTFCMGTSDSLV